MTAVHDCYFVQNEREAILGNSKIEIRLDRHSGAIGGLRNKTAGVEYLGKGTPEVFQLVHCNWKVNGAAPGDLWSAVDGTLVSSSRQKADAMVPEQTADGIRLKVTYDCLRLERRTLPVAVEYTLQLKAGDEETHWQISIHNGDEGTIRAVHFPFIAGLERFDWLILPNHGGQRLVNPVDKLSDEIPQVYLEYPARASMQWFEYYSRQAGLYLASYDQALAYTRMYFGRPQARQDVAMWMVKYPFAASGTSWESPVLSLGIHAGDWHWGADRYRHWTESWMEKPQVPRRVQEMIGGAGDVMLVDVREVIHRYEDMVRIIEEDQKIPNSASYMVVGWYEPYYSEYQPSQELGGEKALVEAIDKIHSMGAWANAYINGRLLFIDSETYRKHGKEWSVITKSPGLGVNTIEFGELLENWGGWCAVPCPFVKEWQDHQVAVNVRAIRDYHFDGIFIDQPGSYWAELCYNKNHGHSTPATAWGPGLLEMFRRIREATRQANPESFLWTEGMNDAYGQYLDYHMDKNPTWEPMRIHPEMETFVEMWRYTLPEYITYNYSLKYHYSYPPSQDRIYGESYYFVLGIRGISATEDIDGREPKRGVVLAETEEEKKRDEVIEKICRLWIKGGKYLFYGRFMDDIGLQVSSPALLAKVYRSEDGIAIPIWNTSGEELACQVTLDLSALGWAGKDLAEATSLDSGAAFLQHWEDSCLAVWVRLPPHDMDGIIIARKG